MCVCGQGNFGSHALPNPRIGFFFQESSTLRDRAFFPQFGSYLLKTSLDLHENFTTNVSLEKEDSIKFCKSSGSGDRIQIQSPDMDSVSGSGLRIWTQDLHHICLGRGMHSLSALDVLVTSFSSWFQAPSILTENEFLSGVSVLCDATQMQMQRWCTSILAVFTQTLR